MGIQPLSPSLNGQACATLAQAFAQNPVLNGHVWQKVSYYIHALIEHDITGGDKIALNLAPGIERQALLAALWSLGAIVIPLDPFMTAARRLLVIQGAGAKLVIHDHTTPPALPQICPHLTLDALSQSTVGGHAPLTKIQAQDHAVILYGEGDQDTRRGVVLTQNAMLVAATGLIQRFGLAPGQKIAVPLPLTHGIRLGFELAILLSGATLTDDLNQDLDLLVLAESEKIPPLCANHHVKIILSNGEARKIRQLQRTFPKSQICNSYSRAELAGVAIASDLRDPSHTSHTTRGRPLLGVEVMIVDPKTGMDMLLYEVGEIWIRAKTLMLHYYDDSAATTQAIESGFFRTGDLGYLDSEGRIILCHQQIGQI